jgi:peptide/nickel transport system substrate-binding protein
MYIKKNLTLALSILLLLALILSACDAATATQEALPQPEVTQVMEATDEPVDAPAPSDPQVPSAPTTTTFIWTQEFDTLNPLYTNIWFSTITHQIWNCWAWDFDDQNAPHAVLVKEIPSLENGGISQDGRVITLKLRDDIVWSDGTPITSADFLFTYQMALDTNNAVPTPYPYDRMSSVETPDERTVVITFPEPFAPWLSTLWHGILPAHILRPVFEADGTLVNSAWNIAPSVSCGPYKFVEWQPGSHVQFQANDNYWLGKPQIDEIIIRFVADEAAQVQALKNGEGDLGTYFNFADAPELEGAGIQIQKVFSGYNEGWFFNLDQDRGHPALQEEKVRQAIALAFDRFTLNNNLQLGLTEPAATYWDHTPYVDPSVQPWPYDIERAKALLDESGWVDSNGNGIRDKNGIEMTLSYGTTNRKNRLDTQSFAVEQIQQVGIQLEPSSYEADVFFTNWGEGGLAATGQLDIFQYSTKTNFPDPDTADWLCLEIPNSANPLGANWSRLCDEELDALFQQQINQVDYQARQQTFHQISKLMNDKVYWLGVWQDPDLWSLSSRLNNVKLSGVTPFYNIAEWAIGQ